MEGNMIDPETIVFPKRAILPFNYTRIEYIWLFASISNQFQILPRSIEIQ